MLDSLFNGIFGGLIAWSPVGSLLVISVIMSLIVTLVYKWTTDQEVLKSLKAEIKELQKQMKEFASDPVKSLQIRKDLNQRVMKQFKSSMKPTLFTLVPFLILFSWMRAEYTPMGPLIIGLSWFWVYLISAVIFGQIFKKIFRVN